MASLTDKFTRASDSNTGRPIIAQLAGSGKGIGATSVTLNAATNWTLTTKIHIAIYNTVQVSGKTIKDTSSQTEWEGTLSGTTISNLTLTGGVDQTYLAGAYVELTPTAKYAKDLYDGLAVLHNPDGTFKAGAVSTTATLADSIVTTAKIADGAVTAAKITSVAADKLTNPYKFSAYLSADQSVTSSTWTKVTLNTENFDTGSNFDATSTYRFTAPVSGYYQINAQVGLGVSGLSANTAAQAALYKNGTSFVQSGTYAGTGNAASIPKAPITDLIYLVATDYIELYAIIYEAARVIAGGQSTFLSGFLVSTT